MGKDRNSCFSKEEEHGQWPQEKRLNIIGHKKGQKEKSQTITSVDEDTQTTDGTKTVQSLWKADCSPKVRPRVTWQPRNSTLRCLARRNGNLYLQSSTWISIEASFAINNSKTNIRQHWNCWINESRHHPYNRTLLSHKKKWDSATWWNVGELWLQAERSQSQKATYCEISFIWNVWNRQSYIESRWWPPGAGQWGEWRLTANGHGILSRVRSMF